MMTFSFLLVSCSKDDLGDIHHPKDMLENRNALEIEHFIYEGLEVNQCCASLWIRTNLLNSFEHIGGVSLNFYKQGAGTVKSITTDSLHLWQYDPSTNGDYPYKQRIFYCFDQAGTYCVGVDATNGGGVGGGISSGFPVDLCFEIKDEGCLSEDDCVQYVCWEEVGGLCQLDSITGFSIILNPPDTIHIPITPIYATGGYYAIVNAILAELQALNWGGVFYEEMPDIGDCPKGGVSPTPGFFFVNSNFQIYSIDGVVNCGDGWEERKIELDPTDNCDY